MFDDSQNTITPCAAVLFLFLTRHILLLMMICIYSLQKRCINYVLNWTKRTHHDVKPTLYRNVNHLYQRHAHRCIFLLIVKYSFKCNIYTHNPFIHSFYTLTDTPSNVSTYPFLLSLSTPQLHTVCFCKSFNHVQSTIFSRHKYSESSRYEILLPT